MDYNDSGGGEESSIRREDGRRRASTSLSKLPPLPGSEPVSSESESESDSEQSMDVDERQGFGQEENQRLRDAVRERAAPERVPENRDTVLIIKSSRNSSHRSGSANSGSSSGRNSVEAGPSRPAAAPPAPPPKPSSPLQPASANSSGSSSESASRSNGNDRSSDDDSREESLSSFLARNPVPPAPRTGLPETARLRYAGERRRRTLEAAMQRDGPYFAHAQGSGLPGATSAPGSSDRVNRTGRKHAASTSAADSDPLTRTYHPNPYARTQAQYPRTRPHAYSVGHPLPLSPPPPPPPPHNTRPPAHFRRSLPPPATSSASPAAARQYASNAPDPAADYVRPRWQPDAEVSACPICSRTFSLFVRRHHCRRCGRVVCAACSPHRITIPRQFIVQPPRPLLGAEEGEEGEDADLDAELEAELEALGGGLEVRLCNPCVPDPNPLPPPRYPAAGPRHAAGRSVDGGGRLFPGSVSAGLPAFSPAAHIHQAPRDVPGTGVHPPYPGAPTRYPHHRVRASESHLPNRSYPARSGHGLYANSHNPPTNFSDMLPPSGIFPAHGQYIPPHNPPHHRDGGPLPPTPPPPPPPVREEDECPICHLELPPKGPDGDEAEREAHVAACINSHFSPPRRAAARPRDVPGEAGGADDALTRQQSSSAPADAPSQIASAASASAMNAGEGPSQQQRRRRTTGIVVYVASEKDCVSSDNAEQLEECVICFEEFMPGEELGRLECLCRFHRVCIRSWWERKGPGNCPVHQGGI